MLIYLHVRKINRGQNTKIDDMKMSNEVYLLTY